MAPSSPAPRRIAIIGGGISGLAAAFELHQREPGASVTLYEAGDRPGGVLQTECRDGLVMELGPDSMLRPLPWGIDLCRRVGLESQIVGTEKAAAGVYTVCRGQLLRMPEGLALMAPRRIWPMVQTSLLSWPGKLRMAAERVLPRRRDESDESLAAFARRRFGEEALQRIIQPLAGGIYMGDPEQLGMQAAFPQLVAAEREHGSLIKSTRRAVKEAAKKPAGETMFAAPERGFGQLVAAIVAHLPDETVCLNHRVENVAVDGDQWRVQGTRLAGGDQADQEGKFDEQFDAILIAAPAAVAARLLAGIDERLATLLGSISSSGCAVVNLAYRAEAVGRPLDAAGIVIPHVEQREIVACTFSSVKYRGRAPEGTVLLRAFLGGAQRPDKVDESDEALLESVRGELRALLDVKGEPLVARVTRWPRSMPQYAVGHTELVGEIEARVAALAGLELIGNAYQGVGIPHCIHRAQQGVGRLLGTDRHEPQVAAAGVAKR